MRVAYVDIGYMNDQIDRADLLARLGLDYTAYLDADGLLELSKADGLLREVQVRKAIIETIEDPDEKGYYLDQYGRFVRFVEREQEGARQIE